jgi:release factor glutamine methyltransferase
VNNKPSRRDRRQPGPASARTAERAAAGVYPEREDTLLLLPFARVRAGTTLAEVGAGAGRASLAAARCGARVVATDLNPTALRGLRAEARAEGLDVETVRTDLLSGLGRFARVLANPPYLPTRPEERDPDRWTNLALDGGRDGCRVLARLVDGLTGHLAPGASAFVVVSSLQDPRSRAAILARWEARGGRQEVVASRDLEGERLEVLCLSAPGSSRLGGSVATRAARRTRARARGIGVRRRSARSIRFASSPAPARGRTLVRGAASDRRRSPRGS